MAQVPAPPPAAGSATQARPELNWWNRLGIRLSIAISLATLATVAVLLFLVLRVQERHLVALVVEATELLSDTIRSSTYHAMLEDRRVEAYRMLETIGRQRDVERVRIFNKEGQITYSTDSLESGTYVDKKAESCYACHAADRPIVRPQLTSRVRIFERENHRVLAMVTPIYNESSCSSAACHVHPASQNVLGVVDLSVSLEPIDAQLLNLRVTTVFVGTLALVAFGIGVRLLVQRTVLRPVSHLVAATRRLARGDLAYKTPVLSRDELGELERSFNEMSQSLAQAREDRLRLLDSLEHQVEERTAQLRRAQEQLIRSEKLSSLGRLAASIAHEINNPLAGILTYAKLLIRTLDDGGTDTDRVATIKQLQLVKRETERCSAIVRNLLDFARERPLDLKDVPVKQVVEDALGLVGNQARLANIEVVKTFDNSPVVHGDFGQLRQACVNLLINACDAMPGGGRLEVHLRRLPGDAVVELSIVDTGCGIPREHLSKVLDPFFTTKDKGTGLGLSVVYGIVERHGGTLDLASEVGVGTTITIRLPAASPADDHDEGEAALGVGAPAARESPGR